MCLLGYKRGSLSWQHPHLCILDLQLDGLLFGLSQLQLPLQQLQTPLSLSHLQQTATHRAGAAASLVGALIKVGVMLHLLCCQSVLIAQLQAHMHSNAVPYLHVLTLRLASAASSCRLSSFSPAHNAVPAIRTNRAEAF